MKRKLKILLKLQLIIIKFNQQDRNLGKKIEMNISKISLSKINLYLIDQMLVHKLIYKIVVVSLTSLSQIRLLDCKNKN